MIKEKGKGPNGPITYLLSTLAPGANGGIEMYQPINIYMENKKDRENSGLYNCKK